MLRATGVLEVVGSNQYLQKKQEQLNGQILPGTVFLGLRWMWSSSRVCCCWPAG